MKTLFSVLIVCILTSAGLSQDEKLDALDGLSEQDFSRLHAELQPRNKTWKTIPWKTSLLDAQRLAVEQKKPILIWAMDGHPLGCT